MDVFWQRLDQGLKKFMPTATAFVMAMLSIIAWPLPHLGSVMPPLSFIALFYWSTHRPDLFPSAVAFLLGLLNDALNGLPLGVSALLYTVARQVIWRQRRFFVGHSFLMLWSGFAIAAVSLMIFEWILVGVVQSEIVPLFPVLTQTALGVLIFPLPCWGMIWLQRVVLSAG